jgi:hypothetical protein
MANDGCLNMDRSSDPGTGKSPDSTAHSFVIKVWLEETREATEPLWRGHITHVFNGKRQYFQQLTQILPFIQTYLNREDSNFR